MLVTTITLLAGCAGSDTSRSDTVATVDSTAMLPALDSGAAVSDTAVDTLVPRPNPTGRLLSPFTIELDSAGAAAQWFVLRQRGSILELIPTRATTAMTMRPCGDSASAVKPTGINGEWIAMIADVAGLRAGAVEAAILNDAPGHLGAQNDSATYNFRDERFVVHSDSLPQGFRLFHEGRGARLTLQDIDAKESGPWRILWAGDLNRDGAPDIITETSDGANVKYVRLYMSGAPPADSLRRADAVHAHEGC